MTDKDEVVREMENLATTPKLNKHLMELYKDAQTGRVLIICALLEDILETAIRSKLVPLSSDIRARIFGGNGPLQNISSKIDIAYALGLLDNRMRSNLHLVRKVRNGFAHATEKVTFDSKDIVALCKRITPDIASNDAQNLFFDAAVATMNHLLDETKKTHDQGSSLAALRGKSTLGSPPLNPAPGQTKKDR